MDAQNFASQAPAHPPAQVPAMIERAQDIAFIAGCFRDAGYPEITPEGATHAWTSHSNRLQAEWITPQGHDPDRVIQIVFAEMTRH